MVHANLYGQLTNAGALLSSQSILGEDRSRSSVDVLDAVRAIDYVDAEDPTFLEELAADFIAAAALLQARAALLMAGAA